MPFGQRHFVNRAPVNHRHGLALLVETRERTADERWKDLARQLQDQRRQTILVGRLAEALIDFEQKRDAPVEARQFGVRPNQLGLGLFFERGLMSNPAQRQPDDPGAEQSIQDDVGGEVECAGF